MENLAEIWSKNGKFGRKMENLAEKWKIWPKFGKFHSFWEEFIHSKWKSFILRPKFMKNQQFPRKY